MGADFSLSKSFDKALEMALSKAQEKIEAKLMEKLEAQAIKGDLEKMKIRTRLAQIVMTCATTIGLVTAVLGAVAAVLERQSVAFMAGFIASIISFFSLIFRIFRFKKSCTKADKIANLITTLDTVAAGGPTEALQVAMDAVRGKKAKKKTDEKKADELNA